MRGRRTLPDLGLVALLLGVAALIAWDLTHLSGNYAQRGPVGPAAVPAVVALLLVACAAVLAVQIVRSRREDAEEPSAETSGEPEQRADRKTLIVLAGALLLTIALIERAGWVIAGALLFWLSCYALGSRNPLRDLAVAAALSIGSFYLFDTGLGLHLPAGILQGIL
ncbi:tripartite tricarboxylate transporter TctB family protein [Nonomuraea sp. M3C6]|uniref:Tripartite tricarboxylate transporter TctB family protein n=1 Tax=Nonomuraea marmarensis TaxID=3351344 RepID=A0ABW7ATR6_9ACTN